MIDSFAGPSSNRWRFHEIHHDVIAAARQQHAGAGGHPFPGSPIVSMQPDGGRHSYTYRDLRKRSRQLAAALEGAGVAKGDRVATLMWNGHAHLEAYFGVPITGAVLHTLNLRLHPDELAYIVNHAQDRFLIVDDVLLDLFEQIGIESTSNASL